MKIRALVFVLLFAPPAPAQKLTAPPDARQAVDRVFSRFNRTSGPGCAVAASLDGTTALSAAYGMADLEHDVLSALINLGCQRNAAEVAVRKAQACGTPAAFEPLFRKALELVR